MDWYVAKIIYRIVCGDGAHKAQFDEQLRLFEASTLPEALQKARCTGESEAVSFFNNKQQMVQWQFIDVSHIYKLHQVVDGTELWSRIEEREDGEAYEHFVRQKAEEMKVATAILQLT